MPNSDPFGISEVEDEFSKLLERDLAEENAAKSSGDLSASFAFLGDDDDLLPDDFIEPVNNREASQPQRPKTVGPTSANSYAPAQPNNHYSSPATYQQPPRSQSAMKQFNTANNSFDLPAAMMPKVKKINSFTTQPAMGNPIVGNFKPNSQPQSPKAAPKKASFLKNFQLLLLESFQENTVLQLLSLLRWVLKQPLILLFHQHKKLLDVLRSLHLQLINMLH